MSKKIGIVTILSVNNYGAELQAFALQNKLNSLGYHAEIINYLFYKNPDFKATKKSKSFVKLGFKQQMKERLYPHYKKIKSLPYHKQKLKRDRKFENFHVEHTNRTAVINTIDKLYAKTFDYDVYMVGSDQVWNPNTHVNLEPYFLTFAPEDKLKIAYASSFGVSEIPPIYEGHYQNLLENLDHIGVREKQGVSIVENLVSKPAKWVLDPTFLLSNKEWSSFESASTIKEPYLLMYILTDAEYITNLARHIAKVKNLKIVRICKNAFVEDKSSDVINIIDAGPKEYLGLFKKASFVLTTSFHGTCFSVNFNIPFFVVLKRNKTNNSRQINLLKELEIRNRILYVGEEFPQAENFDFNFSKSNLLLTEFVTNSIEYLKTSINTLKNGVR
ncbi:polysaccharide pyruvyl transferase family protein [Aquimarina agarivorans]|uniref:polysaccharide pyruvyl transferase family protein n=1 Tax=Aquimarina agarivorans TaxID=980584 RepID=UPI000248EB69|nr:polysaccharide pyruvyl transferase family protein [Aquimarina agarivorans]